MTTLCQLQAQRAVVLVPLEEQFQVFYFNLTGVPKQNWGILPILDIKCQKIFLCTKIMDGINKICHFFSKTRDISGINRHTRCLSTDPHFPLIPTCSTFSYERLPLPICSTKHLGFYLHPECSQKCSSTNPGHLIHRLNGWLSTELVSATTLATNVQRMILFFQTIGWITQSLLSSPHTIWSTSA